ncbi:MULTISPECIES: hypothetical protein [unclassified Mesorhizobium]|uniref:hypothetical protein n=1 Tax=unclassified Mesorhizobium TaxID=325217 RepID=UPI003334CE1A
MSGSESRRGHERKAGKIAARRPSTKAAARAMQVSERRVRMAKAIKHRPDLVAAVTAGAVSLKELTDATGKVKASGLERLRAAYRAATVDEKAEFIAENSWR